MVFSCSLTNGLPEKSGPLWGTGRRPEGRRRGEVRLFLPFSAFSKSCGSSSVSFQAPGPSHQPLPQGSQLATGSSSSPTQPSLLALWWYHLLPLPSSLGRAEAPCWLSSLLFHHWVTNLPHEMPSVWNNDSGFYFLARPTDTLPKTKILASKSSTCHMKLFMVSSLLTPWSLPCPPLHNSATTLCQAFTTRQPSCLACHIILQAFSLLMNYWAWFSTNVVLWHAFDSAV